MQHTAPSIIDAPANRLQLSPHLAADALRQRLQGLSTARLSADLGVPIGGSSGLSSSLCDAHASTVDIADLRAAGALSAARIRPCICCGRPIVSAHPGVRMCRPCRRGDIDYRIG